ncbi:MAG: PKD domain-containing protein [Bacteroidia bacterium]|nr:PKD domain-containing protein [Bacteroidia bacterium]
MKRIFLFILFIFLCSSFADAQISQGGKPFGVNNNYKNVLNANIPTHTMPYVDVGRLQSEDIVNDENKQIPWRFGENIPVDIDIKADGVNDLLPGGDNLWRVRIFSQGAYTINLTFDNYFLPEGAKVFIYNDQKTHILGAFTNNNNQEDHYFATTLIEGDAIIVEYFEPGNAVFPGSLHLSRVTHGYRSVYDYATRAFGGSGSCNNNVVCPVSAGWEDQIRSACMLVVGGSGFCSGSLVNNTANDGTPYVLTANHCSTSNNFSNWVFWFNWQSPTCTNPTTNPPHDQVTTSGCVLKARTSGSDFCLVQMNQAPPLNFNVFYAGWSHEGVISTSAVGIHHPSGDIKKISFAGPTSSATFDGVDSWRADWTNGVTEPGSSGSPLFDANHRIIGQLYGGPSSCSATPENKNDYYGKFSTSWNTGTTPATRLVDWLDPLGTGQLTLDGYDPNLAAYSLDARPKTIDIPGTNYCSLQNIVPAVTIQNVGTSAISSLIVKYYIDGGTMVQQSWSGNLTTYNTATITFPQITLTLGSHVFTVITSSPNDTLDENIANDTLRKNFTVTTGYLIPFTENFENPAFPPADWTVYNPDASITWSRSVNAGGNGTSTAAAYINLLNYNNANNQLDNLISPKIDLTSVDNAQLTFKVAYRRYNAQYSDGLSVLVSADCGATFSNTLYSKSGTVLATGPDLTQAFYPSLPSDWRFETVDLTPYTGSVIALEFQSVNHNGNNLYIDDINIISDMPPAAFYNAPDTFNCTGEIHFTDLSIGIPTHWLWDFGDGSTDTTQNPTHFYTHSGIYTVSLSVSNPYGTNQIIRTDYININMPSLPAATSSSRCGPGSVSLTASGSGVLYWYNEDNYLLGICDTLIIPNLDTTTQFYVENHDEQTSQFVGNTDTTINGGNANFNSEYWLNFECYAPLRLVSVKVNASVSGERKITLRDGNGVPVDSVLVNIPVGVSRVLLNFNLQPGSYRLVGPPNANLWRNNNTNPPIAYPFTIPGLISIISSNITDRYYYFYQWEVKEPDCISARAEVTAYIHPNLTGGLATANLSSVCTEMSTTLTLTGYSGNIQWQQSADSIVGWSDVTAGTGANSNNYVTDLLDSDIYYRAKLSGTGCTDAFSNIVPVTVEPGPVAGMASSDTNIICSNNTVNLSLSGSIGNIQWQQSPTGSSGWQNISGATDSSFTTPQLFNNIFFRAVVSRSSCPDAFSNVVNINVNPATEGGFAIAVPSDICLGSSSMILLSGQSGNIQWLQSGDSISWIPITNADSSVLTTPVLTDTVYYQAILSQQGCPDDYSSVAVVFVHEIPSAWVSTVNASYGSSNGLATVNASGGSGNYTFLWDANTGNQTTQTASGLAAGTYHVTVYDGFCSFVALGSVEENPSYIPIADFSVNTQLICTETTLSFSDISTNNPASWNWTFSGGTPACSIEQNPQVTYNNAGVFTVTLVSTNQYGSDTITKTQYITVTAPGTLSFDITNESYPGAGNGAVTVYVLGGNPPYSYHWNTGATTPFMMGLNAGTYSVAVIDASGCFITGPVTVDVIQTVLSENSQGNGYLIFPNPTSQKILIQSLGENIIKIEIMDVLGNLLQVVQSMNKNISIDLSSYSDGIYIVKLYTETHIYLQKILLAK